MFSATFKRAFAGFSSGVVAVALAVSGAVSAGAVDLAAEAVVDTAAPAAVYSDAQYPQDGAAGRIFRDVPNSAAFAREIGWLAASGVSTGWPDGTFKPVTAVNRDAMAAFMYRLAGKPAFTPPKVSPFTDVAPGYLFYKEITWLAAQGISTGWAEPGNRRSFRPVQPVNRDAMAAFMYRLAGKPVQSPSAGARFRDVPAGRAFSTEIGWLASTGISTGWADGTFRPLQAVNRDAMAAFMYRFLVRALPFTAGNTSTVHLGPLATGHSAGLVRLSVKDAKDAVTVTVTGAPALTVPSGTSASTTVLAPLADGAITVSASNDASVAVQLIATFDGVAAVPGSTIALASPVTRADTDRQLAGGQLSTVPIDVGVTGAGGVPATEVRAVFVTATVTLAAPDTFNLGDQRLKVAAGVTSITTMLLPSETGTVSASLGAGTGSLRLDVRGYVTDAAQEAPNVNVSGSFVPTKAPTPKTFTATSGATPVSVGGPAGSEAALMLVSADSAGAGTTVLDVVPGTTTGVGGALVDATRGAQPQLAFIPLRKGQPTARIGAGSAAAVALPLGTLLAAPSIASGSAPDVSITSPAASASVNLGEVGKLTLEGSVTASSAHLAAMTVTVGGTAVGTPKVRQSGQGTHWTFETSLPQSGQVNFTVSATDRAGNTGSSSVLINASLPAASAQIISPDAVQLDDAVNPVQSVTPTSVTVANNPDLEPGQIIVEGPSPAAPDGLLRRVTAVDSVGSATVATTTPASLADVFLQVDYSQEVPLDGSQGLAVTQTGTQGDNSAGLIVEDEGIPAATVEAGSTVSLDTYTDTAAASWADAEVAALGPTSARMTAQSTRPAALVPQALIDEHIQFASHIALKDTVTCDLVKGCMALGKTSDATIQKAKAAIASSAGFSLGGEAKVGFTLTFTLKTDIQWDWGKPRAVVEEFSTVVHTEMSAKATGTAFLKTATNQRFKHQLATLNMAPITFVVLTIPVVIRPGGTVYLEGNFSAATSLTVELGVERSQDFGVRYSSNGGFRSVNTGPVTKFSTPVFGPNGTAAVTGKIEAGFGPTFKAGLLIYGFAGPTLTIGAQAGASASITMATTGNKVDASLYIKGDVIVGVELTVPIIDKKILDAVIISGNYTWKIKTWQWDYVTTFPGTEEPSTPAPNPSPLPAEAVPSVTGAGSQGYRLLADGTVLSWGGGTTVPRPVSGLTGVRSIAAGYGGSAYALKSDGTLWAWGANGFNQLGDGTTTTRLEPVKVPGLTNVTAVAAMFDGALALTSDGRVWTWGRYAYTDDGMSALTRPVPTLVPGLANVKAIAGGSGAAYAIKTDGTLWAWGENGVGEIGDGTIVRKDIPVQVPGLSGVKSISAGHGIALAMLTDGRVFGWGSNSGGSIGDGSLRQQLRPVPVPGLSGAKAVVAGDFNSYALMQDGSVRAWGYNADGAVGDGTLTDRYTPVTVVGLTNVVSVGAGSGCAFAVLQNGDAYAWGINLGGRLGDGTFESRSTPVQIG